jgi:hypothetical protein
MTTLQETCLDFWEAIKKEDVHYASGHTSRRQMVDNLKRLLASFIEAAGNFDNSIHFSADCAMLVSDMYHFCTIIIEHHDSAWDVTLKLSGQPKLYGADECVENGRQLRS